MGRDGGQRDESEVYINYTIKQLMQMLARQKRHFRVMKSKIIKIKNHIEYDK